MKREKEKDRPPLFLDPKLQSFLKSSESVEDAHGVKEVWKSGDPPTVLLLRLRYEALGVMNWSADRTRALAARTGLTIRELAALAGVFSNGTVSAYIAANRWAPPAALHLVRIEQFLGPDDGLPFKFKFTASEDDYVADVKRRYEREGVFDWNDVAVSRLCKAYNLTLREMCAIAGMFEPTEVIAAWRTDRWPPAVGLHFTHLEIMLDRALWGSIDGV